MVDEIKTIFGDCVNSSRKLTIQMKKYPEILKYCEERLKKEPEWEKISYLIIGIVKRNRIKEMFILWKVN